MYSKFSDHFLPRSKWERNRKGPRRTKASPGLSTCHPDCLCARIELQLLQNDHAAVSIGHVALPTIIMFLMVPFVINDHLVLNGAICAHLAHSRLSQQDRVVFGAARQDLRMEGAHSFSSVFVHSSSVQFSEENWAQDPHNPITPMLI
eukprot:scaffold10691_cov19-Tisochrysis_lutea.AAC.2